MDVLIAAFSLTDGTFMWAKCTGGPGLDYIRGLSYNRNAGLFTYGGNFEGKSKFSIGYDEIISSEFGSSGFTSTFIQTPVVPPGPVTPVRNSIDETCPSPIARRLMTKRSSPSATPDWSGDATIDGFVSAAASTEYSWVK